MAKVKNKSWKRVFGLPWRHQSLAWSYSIYLVVATLAVSGLLTIIFPSLAEACYDAQMCSGSYEVNEAFFGSGGAQGYGDGTCYTGSANYCADETLGETGIGNTAGTTYQAQAGFNTARTPSLTFTVTAASINVGVLSPSTTATATSNFSIKTYLADSYAITTDALPPQMGTYHMQTPSVATASTPGTEQFGINLVANTTPSSLSGVSAAPACKTSGFCNLGSISIGSNYDQANKFYYPASGVDTLVTADSSSGTTDYTISYIFNISNVTPGGTYTFNQVLVATSTF